MTSILRLYVIREIALPTVLALLTITFILLIGIVYEFINLLLQPGISVWRVFYMLTLLLPSYISFALPMSILMGTLVGIGRMTLDREILAIRASGVNLFKIFVPTLLVSFIISLGVMWAASNLVPRWMGRGFGLLAELNFELIQALEPGRFHDELGVGDKSEMVLYFRERDESSPDRDMKGVMLKLEQKVSLSRAARTSATLARLAAANTTATLSGSDDIENTSKSRKSSSRKNLKTDELPLYRSNMLTLITAERGQIRAQVGDETGLPHTGSVRLTLLNGAIFRHDPEKGDDMVINFETLEKRIYPNMNIKKAFKTMTNAELRPLIGRIEKSQRDFNRALQKNPNKKEKDRPRNQPKRELIERYALSLAFFVFALLAIPLAIWIKPSGKSWGILLAVALMLFYYVFMKIGGTMVEIGHPLGVIVAFFPNLLFTLLGAGLWRQNLKS